MILVFLGRQNNLAHPTNMIDEDGIVSTDHDDDDDHDVSVYAKIADS